jgi:hypothetical protein
MDIDVRDILKKQVDRFFEKTYFNGNYPEMMILTFIDKDKINDELVEHLKEMKEWVSASILVDKGKCIWLIEDDMVNNLFCRKSGLLHSPVTIITDCKFNIIYQRLGEVKKEHLNTISDIIISEYISDR